MSREGEGGSLLTTVWMIHAYTVARTGNAIIRDEVLAWESAIRQTQTPGPA